MLRLLLKVRFKSYLNQFRRVSWGKRIGALALLLAYLYVGVMLSLLFVALFKLFQRPELAVLGLDYHLLGVLFLAVLALLLVSGNSFTIYTIFLSPDLPLLSTFPLSRRTIFTGKFLEGTALNALIALVFLWPVMLGFGLAHRVTFVYYPVALAGLFLLVLVPTGLSVFTALFFIRILPVTRIKEIMAAAGSILGIAIWVGSQLVSQRAEHAFSGTQAYKTVESLRPLLDRPWFDYLPSHWMAKTLCGIAGLDFPVLFPAFLTVTFATLFFFGCLLLAERVYYRGLSALQSEAVRQRKRKKPRTIAIPLPDRVRSPLWAIAIKDLRTTFRNFNLLINIAIFPLMVILMPVLMSQNQKMPSGIGHLVQYFLIFFLLIMAASQMGMRTVPLEGKGFWLLLTSPLALEKILWSKLWSSLFLVMLIAVAGLVSLGLLRGVDVTFSLFTAVASLCAAAGAAALGIWQGAAYANFDWTNPKRMIKGAGGITFVFINLGYIAVWAVIIGLTYLAMKTLHLPVWLAAVVLALLGISVAWALTMLSIKRAAVSIAKREWEY